MYLHLMSAAEMLYRNCIVSKDDYLDMINEIDKAWGMHAEPEIRDWLRKRASNYLH